MNEFAIGSKHFAWTVIGEVYQSKSKRRGVDCQCDCGVIVFKELGHLKIGKGKHCRACGQVSRRKNAREGLFWSHIDIKSDKDCWEWQLHLNVGGYGQTTKAEFGTPLAHRIAFMYTNNVELASDQHLMHSCDNRKCCNPNHLSIGTQADNMRDMKEKGRRKGIGVGADNGRAVVNQEQADEMRRIYAKGGISQEKLGKRYGLTQTAVSAIILNKRFTEAA